MTTEISYEGDSQPVEIRRAIAALWASTVLHYYIAGVHVELNVPKDWFQDDGLPGPLATIVADGMVFFGLGLSLACTWIVTTGVGKRQRWSRAIVTFLLALSIPFRLLSVIANVDQYSNLAVILGLLALDSYVVVVFFSEIGKVWFSGLPISPEAQGS